MSLQHNRSIAERRHDRSEAESKIMHSARSQRVLLHSRASEPVNMDMKALRQLSQDTSLRRQSAKTVSHRRDASSLDSSLSDMSYRSSRDDLVNRYSGSSGSVAFASATRKDNEARSIDLDRIERSHEYAATPSRLRPTSCDTLEASGKITALPRVSLSFVMASRPTSSSSSECAEKNGKLSQNMIDFHTVQEVNHSADTVEALAAGTKSQSDKKMPVRPSTIDGNDISGDFEQFERNTAPVLITECKFMPVCSRSEDRSAQLSLPRTKKETAPKSVPRVRFNSFIEIWQNNQLTTICPAQPRRMRSMRPTLITIDIQQQPLAMEKLMAWFPHAAEEHAAKARREERRAEICAETRARRRAEAMELLQSKGPVTPPFKRSALDNFPSPPQSPSPRRVVNSPRPRLQQVHSPCPTCLPSGRCLAGRKCSNHESPPRQTQSTANSYSLTPTKKPVTRIHLQNQTTSENGKTDSQWDRDMATQLGLGVSLATLESAEAQRHDGLIATSKTHGSVRLTGIIGGNDENESSDRELQKKRTFASLRGFKAWFGESSVKSK
ncbi:hypothetical protein P153DRAFT_380940 [Dothidotthia symphoricarpi CBS 119687]|uniref:Uncharacterized protein n=1 Tax=Dothidotthia symphoricarpi CBS 119687 TaxID=1392245 RepID=A0A6A6ARF8_9PLEO|nr:uncharacterized protein P153DRAFT_380940 [Dothidotthia symphoricarpi CBS 119687]KAF2133758.1 hypothetical protein P153DRAFT_380940 [Dothidotthia symphoricarpi CBS 119687]